MTLDAMGETAVVGSLTVLALVSTSALLGFAIIGILGLRLYSRLRA